MRREGTPAWMQAVERRLEQAAEDARSRPAQTGIQPARHSGEGRNPVGYASHSRLGGNDNSSGTLSSPATHTTKGQSNTPARPLDSSAARSRRRSTTYIPVGEPSPACRRQAGMTTGALFQHPGSPALKS